jgi:NTE family protein
MTFTLLVIFLVSTNAPILDTADVETPSIRIGLALSGGAALGLAHIGVLKVLEREGIDVCCVSGNSMGSLVGGLYSAGYSAAELESIAVHADFRRLFSSSIPFGAQYLPERQRSQRYILNLSHSNFIPALAGGLISLQNVEFLLMRLLSPTEYDTYYEFDSLPIPYRAIAVNLTSGEIVVLKNGRLEQAIRASIAIPGVFAPETIDSLVLVDGGVQRLLPVEPLLEFEPDIIIASITKKTNETETGIELIDVVSRTMNLINLGDLRAQTALADIVIEPNVDRFMASDFSRAADLITVGVTAAEKMIPQIKELIKERHPFKPTREKVARSMPIIASISFEGHEITRPSVLSKIIKTEQNTRLDFQRIIDDMVNLYNTGLFLNVNYRLESASDTVVDLIFELKEQDYGFYNLGLRYDNADNILMGLAVGQGNLWGSGASIRAVVNIGNPREVRLGLTGTRLFAFPFGYRIDLFRGAIDRAFYDSGEWQGDYITTYYGTIAEVGYILGRNAFFNLGIAVNNFNYQFPPEIPVFDTLPDQDWVIGPTFNLEFNSFDNLQLPTKGSALSISILFSNKTMRSSDEFLRVNFSTDHYLRISSRLLIHPGMDLGFSSGDMSWSHYFFSEPQSVIGTKKEEYTTPQIATARLSFDFRAFNFLGQDDYPFYIQALSSITTFSSLADLGESDDIASHLYWGIGAGARANTPIGPFQLVVGIGEHGRFDSEDVELNYHISIGREFRYTR